MPRHKAGLCFRTAIIRDSAQVEFSLWQISPPKFDFGGLDGNLWGSVKKTVLPSFTF
jgi:hypothetical protein